MENDSEEHIALRRLVDTWGRKFAIAFFVHVSEDDLARCYYGLPIDAGALAKIQKVLKERMPHD
jgi:hypothetical protein